MRVTQLDNGALPTQLSDYPILATGTYDGEGYITINLNTPYKFTSNNKCAVIVELIPNSTDSEICLPAEGNYNNSFKINENESFYYIDDNTSDTIEWRDCIIDGNETGSFTTGGNFCIRPVLHRINDTTHNVTVSPTEIIDNSSDAVIMVDSDSTLFNIHASNGRILRQDIDYEINGNNVTIAQSYIEAQNNISQSYILNSIMI